MGRRIPWQNAAMERGVDPKRKDRLRSEIVVDDTREVAGFLRLTSAEGGWRIVIIDSAALPR